MTESLQCNPPCPLLICAELYAAGACKHPEAQPVAEIEEEGADLADQGLTWRCGP